MGWRAGEIPVFLPRFYVERSDFGYCVRDRATPGSDGEAKLMSFDHSVKRALEVAHALNAEQAV